MRKSTKQRQQLATVKEWLKKARPDLEAHTKELGWSPEMSLLIACEQLVKYCEQLEEELNAVLNR